MATKKKSIVMVDHERRFLEEAYVRRRIPLDQYEERQSELHELCEEWRSQFGRNESDGDIFHYMRTRRKNGRKKNGNWPKLGDSHEQTPEHPDLTAEQKEVLIDIYYEHVADLGNGSDNIAYEPEVKAMIATEFMHRTGRGVDGSMLVGILTALRKRGLLPKVRSQDDDGDATGFNDIALVG